MPRAARRSPLSHQHATRPGLGPAVPVKPRVNLNAEVEGAVLAALPGPGEESISRADLAARVAGLTPARLRRAVAALIDRGQLLRVRGAGLRRP